MFDALTYPYREDARLIGRACEERASERAASIGGRGRAARGERTMSYEREKPFVGK